MVGFAINGEIKMLMIEKIKNDLLRARMDRNADLIALLNPLYAQSISVGKDKRNDLPTDDEVFATIKSFIKSSNVILDVDKNNKKAMFEKTILETFLPKMLTENELRDKINSYKINNNVNIGQIMSYLKKNYNNQYDASLASKIAKEI